MSELNKSFMIINGQIIGATGEKVYSTSPIGTVLSYAGQTAPNGYLLCNGASYLVKDYPDLYAVIGNTYGGDSTNFNVPNLVDKFIQGSTTSGKEKEAGLPNIVGSLGMTDSGGSGGMTPEGAFANTTFYDNESSNNGTGSKRYKVSFNASISNPIYGNSDTVQPPALTMVYIIKAFHTNEGTDVEVELSDTVINKISQKATEIINDNTVNPKSVWSSQKVNDELEDVRNELDIIVEEANKSTSINDSVTSQTTVWSSKYTSEKIAGVIDDTKSSGDTATTWSSKKTSDELAQKLNVNNNVSMVGLGFTKGDTVHVSDFLGALVAKFGRNGYCNMLYANASSATVVNSAGTQSVLINGGVLYFSATNEKFPNDTWSYAEAIYYPIEGIQGKMYKFFARTSGEAGTVGNSGIYQYSSDIEIINDTVSNSTSTYSSAKIDEKIATYSLNTQDGKQKWLVLNLGGAGQSHPITVSDHYGGEIEIIGMSSKYATNSSYKTVKVIRHSYGDWNLDSATDYTTTTSGDGNYKIRGVYYNPNDNKYYVEIRQYASIKVSGAVVSAPTMVDYSSVAASEMTAIPESMFASKKDIDGTTIKTTSTTGSEYYAITFKDKQFERGNNQGILIQHNRLNFEPVTFIFSASSYGAAVYERDNYDVTKINGSFYNPTSPYMMQFYMDKTNNTLYLSVPSYSGVSLTDLQFKSDVISYTKVDAIPDTATKITVTEYATKADLGSNVPMTEIAFTNSTNWSNSSGNLKTFYMVRNGWCFLHVVAHCNKVANDNNSVVYGGLPIPPFQVYGKFVGEDNTYEPCNLTVATNGQMLLRGGTAGKDYSFTYTYPVV